jgi:hypothetical protein
MFTGQNQYSVQGRKIDVQKFARIDGAPEVLVLQLKRFDYNLVTLERIKVKDRYEFHRILDIVPCMTDSSVSRKYHLKGVVLHSGSAQGGHYSSLILINGKWVMFNDMEVTVLPEADFDEATFGSTLNAYDEWDNTASAYLLFYVRENSKVVVNDTELAFDSMFDLTGKCDPRMVAEIEKENEEFSRLQAVFGSETFDFVCKIPDLTTVLMYFVNVFCHSGLAIYAESMKSTLNSFLEGNRDKIVQYFSCHFDSVKNVLVQCGSTEIMSLLTDFLIQAFRDQDVFNFVQKVLEILPIAFNTSWRQIIWINKLLSSWISQKPDNVKTALAANWFSDLADFVQVVYGEPRSSMILQNLDLSDLFRILTKLAAEMADPSSSAGFLPLASQIVQSKHHSREFSHFLVALHNNKAIDIEVLVNSLSQGKADSEEGRYVAIMSLLRSLDDPVVVKQLLNMVYQKRVTKTDSRGIEPFVSKLSIWQSDETLGIDAFLLRFPRETLLEYLIDDRTSVRASALRLGQAIFRDVPLSVKEPLSSHVPEPTILAIKSLCATQLEHMQTLKPAQFGDIIHKSLTEREPGRFHHYLKYFQWLIRCLGYFEPNVFQAVIDFYNRLVKGKYDIAEAAICVSLMGKFPLFEPLFQRCFNDIFSDFREESAFIIPVFQKFSHYLFHGSIESFHFLLEHPAMSIILEQMVTPRGYQTFVQKFSQVVLGHADDQICFGFLVKFFEAGFSCSPDEFYVTILEKIIHSLDSFVIDSIISFAVSILSQPSGQATAPEYLYVLKLMKTLVDAKVPLENFEPCYEGVLEFARTRIALDFERLLIAVFLGICRTREYRKGVIGCAKQVYLRQAGSVRPNSNVIMLSAHLAVFSGWDDAEIVSELLDLLNAIRQEREPETTKSRFYHELSVLMRGEWPKLLLYKLPMGDLASGGAAKSFFEKALARMNPEEGIAFLTEVVKGKVDTCEWEVVSQIFRRFPEQKDQMREILPVQERFRTTEPAVGAAIDVVFGTSETKGALQDDISLF